MLGSSCILRFAVSLTIAISTLSVAAQDTPVGQTTKAPGTAAQPAATDTAALAKATQNPVASLISVPLQNNSNFGIGPYNRTGDIFNIQPVIPMKLSDKVMLITRIIQPLVWQPYPSQPTGGQAGIGDMNPTFFLSPAKPGKLIYGAGPAFILPTATSTQTGQGKFSLGPSVVALMQPGHWTVGVLINNVFSVTGSSHRPDVNQMLLQYFANYNLNKGYYLDEWAHRDSELEFDRFHRRGDWERRSRGHMDRAVRRRRRPNQAAWIPANKLDPAVLRKRNPSAGRFTVEF